MKNEKGCFLIEDFFHFPFSILNWSGHKKTGLLPGVQM